MLSEERNDSFAPGTLRQTRQSIQHRQVCLAGAILLEALAARMQAGELVPDYAR